MSEPYTSLETSLRLKEAGAPQHTLDAVYWVDYHIGGGPELSRDTDPNECYARAFRADEIIEALGPCLRAIYVGLVGVYEVEFEALDLNLEPLKSGSIENDSLVEALAAAWLAVLEAQK